MKMIGKSHFLCQWGCCRLGQTRRVKRKENQIARRRENRQWKKEL